MEKIVNRQKRDKGDKRRNISFIFSFTSLSTLFREYENGHLSSILNGGNVVNAVRHGMPCIRFQQEKRPKRYPLFTDIARRQFVPTNCSCSPCQTVGEIRP